MRHKKQFDFEESSNKAENEILNKGNERPKKKQKIKFIEDRYNYLIEHDKSKDSSQGSEKKKRFTNRWTISEFEDLRKKEIETENKPQKDIALNPEKTYSNKLTEKAELNQTNSSQKRKNNVNRDISRSFSIFLRKRDYDLLNYNKKEKIKSLKQNTQIKRHQMDEKPQKSEISSSIFSNNTELPNNKNDEAPESDSTTADKYSVGNDHMISKDNSNSKAYGSIRSADTSFDSRYHRKSNSIIENTSSLSDNSSRKKGKPEKTPLDYLVEEAHLEQRKMDQVESLEQNRNIRSRQEKYRMLKLQEKELNEKIDEIEESQHVDDSLFHTRMENDVRMYLCPQRGCHKQFPSLSRVKRHYIVHTGQKPYKCLNESCRKTFSRKDNMLQHYRNHCYLSRKTKFTEFEP